MTKYKWVAMADEVMHLLDAVETTQSGANEQTIKLRAELMALIDDVYKVTRIGIELADIVDNLCITMQASLIEQSIGNGKEAALEWIFEVLRGPGLLPNMSDAENLPRAPMNSAAQAWFDVKTSASKEFRLENPGPVKAKKA